jgi:hypothetical protein
MDKIEIKIESQIFGDINQAISSFLVRLSKCDYHIFFALSKCSAKNLFLVFEIYYIELCLALKGIKSMSPLIKTCAKLLELGLILTSNIRFK